MCVEKFKIKIEKDLFWVLVLIKDLWTWITIASKQSILKKFEMMLIDYPRSKNICKLLFLEFEILKLKIYKYVFFLKYFTTCKWGVMYMTSKKEVLFHKKKKS
jgi:hypothetical protein